MVQPAGSFDARPAARAVGLLPAGLTQPADLPVANVAVAGRRPAETDLPVADRPAADLAVPGLRTDRPVADRPAANLPVADLTIADRTVTGILTGLTHLAEVVVLVVEIVTADLAVAADLTDLTDPVLPVLAVVGVPAVVTVLAVGAVPAVVAVLAGRADAVCPLVVGLPLGPVAVRSGSGRLGPAGGGRGFGSRASRIAMVTAVTVLDPVQLGRAVPPGAAGGSRLLGGWPPAARSRPRPVAQQVIEFVTGLNRCVAGADPPIDTSSPVVARACHDGGTS